MQDPVAASDDGKTVYFQLDRKSTEGSHQKSLGLRPTPKPTGPPPTITLAADHVNVGHIRIARNAAVH